MTEAQNFHTPSPLRTSSPLGSSYSESIPGLRLAPRGVRLSDPPRHSQEDSVPLIEEQSAADSFEARGVYGVHHSQGEHSQTSEIPLTNRTVKDGVEQLNKTLLDFVNDFSSFLTEFRHYQTEWRAEREAWAEEREMQKNVMRTEHQQRTTEHKAFMDLIISFTGKLDGSSATV
ncbi:hypothetical protein VKT23_020023 [Stygiomarasmius scandens]|uniref:Uncharacterized protein n=1 Tax=Marasmiellus scandens TaxID=2682957 RepID=A0ABR1ILZ8_9AGAR